MRHGKRQLHQPFPNKQSDDDSDDHDDVYDNSKQRHHERDDDSTPKRMRITSDCRDDDDDAHYSFCCRLASSSALPLGFRFVSARRQDASHAAEQKGDVAQRAEQFKKGPGNSSSR